MRVTWGLSVIIEFLHGFFVLRLLGLMHIIFVLTRGSSELGNYTKEIEMILSLSLVNAIYGHNSKVPVAIP